MASKCKCCSNSILNSEFVTCSGQCNELFHIKCVAVNKLMLNAINACPNIHWYCHECNAGNRNISASIDRINEAIGGLTGSLSKDLLQFVDGFKTQMEKFTDAFSTAIVPPISNFKSVSSKSSSDAGRACGDDGPEMISACKSKLNSFHCTSPVASRYNKEPLKSVVLSNIGKDVSTEYLKDYLSDKLRIARDKLSVSLLLPSDRSFDEMSYLQFKVTVPEINYSSVVCPKLWPTNVHVRDFVFKHRKNGTVTRRQFLDSLCSTIGSPVDSN